MTRSLSIAACAAVMFLGLATAAISQNSQSRNPRAPASVSDSASEREKIWNSPTMLRARAWVQEYCQRSAKITPEEEQTYMKELQNLTPTQMKLWLLKFEHEQEMIRKQQADFEMTRKAHLNQAMAVNQATQQAYANINRDENEAAATEEKSLQIQAAEAADRQQAKQDETALDASNVDTFYSGYGDLYSPYLYGPWGGYGAVPHIHVHVHPE